MPELTPTPVRGKHTGADTPVREKPKGPSVANRITKYDAAEWLAFLVQQMLIEAGESVVALHQRMMADSELCELTVDESDVEEWSDGQASD